VARKPSRERTENLRLIEMHVHYIGPELSDNSSEEEWDLPLGKILLDICIMDSDACGVQGLYKSMPLLVYGASIHK